jgi:hypothetical protein
MDQLLVLLVIAFFGWLADRKNKKRAAPRPAPAAPPPRRPPTEPGEDPFAEIKRMLEEQMRQAAPPPPTQAPPPARREKPRRKRKTPKLVPAMAAEPARAAEAEPTSSRFPARLARRHPWQQAMLLRELLGPPKALAG